MSHYSVAVIHKADQSVDKLLEPFYEGLEVEQEEDEDGVYFYNPKAKWDWYDIGGRWNNLITTITGSCVNCAKISDIDFTLDSKKYKKASRFWEIVVEHAEPKDYEKDICSFYGEKYYRDRFDSKDDYATYSASFLTHAILTPDGEWLEAGEMGWFGMSSASSNEDKRWYQNYKSIIEEYPDYYMTIVDCHI